MLRLAVAVDLGEDRHRDDLLPSQQRGKLSLEGHRSIARNDNARTITWRFSLSLTIHCSNPAVPPAF
jgi:hypothetical protein